MSVFEMEGIDDRYVSMIFATECKKVRSRRGKERARFGLYILALAFGKVGRASFRC